jgi:hypothetical protein
MLLGLLLLESAIDCHEHQSRHSLAVAARALPGLLPSSGIANMYAGSVSSRAYLFDCMLPLWTGIKHSAS